MVNFEGWSSVGENRRWRPQVGLWQLLLS